MPSSRSSPSALEPITSAMNGRIERQEELLHERREARLRRPCPRRPGSAPPRAESSGASPSRSDRRRNSSRRSGEPEERAVHSASPAARVVGEVGVDALEVVAERLDACRASRRGRAPAASAGARAHPRRPSRRRACRRRAGRRWRGPRPRARARAPAPRRRPRCAACAGRSRMRSRIAPVSPSATSRPLTSTTTRGAMRSTSCSTCEETSTVRPSAPSRRISSTTWRRCDGIEAVERLVEQQQLGRVHERLGQLDALAHALREAADARARRRPRARRSRSPRPPPPRGRPRRAASAIISTSSRAVRNGQRPSRSWTMPMRR